MTYNSIHCPVCKKEFLNLKELREHKISEHEY